jgi:uncharacterized protein YbjT (DUF2867 family)
MIVITGASGKTGGYAAGELLDRGQKIRVIARDPMHVRHLTQRGAEPAIGTMLDVDFLGRAFEKADSVYLIIPPDLKTNDPRQRYQRFGDAAVEAIRRAGVTKLVFLSSLGAERESGNGPIAGLHDVEQKLEALSGVDIVFLRAGFFYENTLQFIDQIRDEHSYSYPADPNAPILMVGAKDIGLRAAELLHTRRFFGHSAEELFGDRLTFHEAIGIIGEKLGYPSLRYVRASANDAIIAMVQRGISESMAKAYVELAEGLSRGLITATRLNPEKPNASMRFKKFVELEFYEEFRKAA